MRKSTARPPPERKVRPRQRPVHTIRHRRLKASVWRNDTDRGPVYNVTVVRGYRTGQGWRDSHSFSYDDLPVVAKLLNDAHAFVTQLRERDAKAPRSALAAAPA